MSEHVIKVDKSVDLFPYIPKKTTRGIEILLGIIALVNEGKTTDEILDILNLNIVVMRSVVKQVPSLPIPEDWEKFA